MSIFEGNYMFSIHLNLGFRVYYYEGFDFFTAGLAVTSMAVDRLKRVGLESILFMGRMQCGCA